MFCPEHQISGIPVVVRKMCSNSFYGIAVVGRMVHQVWRDLEGTKLESFIVFKMGYVLKRPPPDSVNTADASRIRSVAAPMRKRVEVGTRNASP